jgi:hypothetical protein
VKSVLRITAIIIVISGLILYPFFVKVRIECKSQTGACPVEIENGISKMQNQSLFRSRSEISRFLKSQPLVLDFSEQFKLPNILRVDILTKEPLFALKDSTSGNIDLVEKNGVVLSVTQSSSLPTVVVVGGIPAVGQKVGDQNLFALNIEAGVYEMYQIQTSYIQNGGLIVDMPGGVRVIFPLEGDYQVLLGALRLIYSKIQSEPVNPYSQIDLRYKNPVLR